MTNSNNTDARTIIGTAIQSVSFEGLEDRKLMSGISFAHNTVTITGNDNADDIRVSLSADGRTLSAKLNNGAAKTFKATDVYQINVNAGCGENTVMFDPNITANARIKAGDGRDTISTGAGNDNIDAGPSGDKISTGRGNDYIFAGTGNDRVDLGSGNDNVDGGAGSDTLISGVGKDSLRGQDGNDNIYAKKGDGVDGGSGVDLISFDSVPTDGTTPTPTPVDPPKQLTVTKLSLVNADTGAVISGYDALTDGMTLDLSKLPAHLTVVAQVSGNVQSAKFALSDGSINRVDNTAAYSLTNEGGNKYTPWSAKNGTVTLSVTPYGSDSAAGSAGKAMSLTLKLKNATSEGTTPTPTPVPVPVPVPVPTPIPTPTPTQGGAGSPQIHVNAISTTIIAGQAFHAEAASTVVPGYQAEDATFNWNFGDPSGDWNVLPGFNSAHVYETPGTYTAKLTVTAPNGKTSVQNITVNVVASNYSTVYVSASGSDSNNGSSQNSPVKTLSRALAISGDNTKILFKRGESFPMTSTVGIKRNNLVISSYGTGTQPTLLYTGSRSGTPNMLIVEKASNNVVIQGLTFNSIYSTNFNEDGMPHAIVNGGTATTIRDNTFLNLAYAVNANYQPHGMLVMDNKAPLVTGLRAYFVWCQGTDLVIVGNEVANSTRQHNIRSGGTDRFAIVYNKLTNLSREGKGDNADVAKGTIVAQKGSYAYAAYNELRGPVGVGPLGQKDGLADKAGRFNHAAFEGNQILSGGTIDVHHGANNITLRGNVNYVDSGAPAFKVEGWSNSYGRGVSDIVIDHNIAITQFETGQFLWLLASVDGVTLTNNVYVAPNLKAGSAGTAAVYVAQSDLSSFNSIDNNTWPSPSRSNGFARGGIAFVGTSYTSENHKTPTEWNSLGKVGDDQFTDVGMNNISNIIRLTTDGGTQAGLRLAA
jgi:hypothetical protein